VNIGVVNLAELSRQALAAGSPENAQRLAGEALRRDPNDKAARAVQVALAKRQPGGPPAAADQPSGPPPEAAGAGSAVPPPPALGQPALGQPALGGASDLTLIGPPAGPPAGAMAESFDRDRKLITDVIRTEVTNVVNRGRSQMSASPEVVTQDLKLMLDRVRQVPELSPDVRNQLVDVIQAALREAARRTVELEQRRQQQNENLAAARERELVSENLQRKQEKLKQLMQRFDSLMDEGRFLLAEQVATQARDAAHKDILRTGPENPVALDGMLASRTKGYYDEAMTVREMRQKGVIDMLATVERSHVPTPDDPPIVYPDAEVWRELTARRKEKYSSMDLAKHGTAEKKIEDALKSPTEMDFNETPLGDVRDRLPEGLPPDRDSDRQQGPHRRRHRSVDHGRDEAPQRDLLAVGLAPDAPRTGPHVRHPKRSLADYHT
jgi:hypothetical protein